MARGEIGAKGRRLKHEPGLAHERALAGQGYAAIAGVDEVGRGAWAGPLVAAAVILPAVGSVDAAADLAGRLLGVRDSKLLTPARREALALTIAGVATAIGVGVVPAGELDRLGLAAANREALRRAVAALPLAADYLLLDAFRLPTLSLPQRAIIRGDRACLSIAAASIVAKVTRDRLLQGLDTTYPGYGFARHKGYGTAAHQAALQMCGLCPEHRRTFAPIGAILAASTGRED